MKELYDRKQTVIDILDNIKKLEERERYYCELAKINKAMKNFDVACLEFLDAEIRILELVYFCQNGRYQCEQ